MSMNRNMCSLIEVSTEGMEASNTLSLIQSNFGTFMKNMDTTTMPWESSQHALSMPFTTPQDINDICESLQHETAQLMLSGVQERNPMYPVGPFPCAFFQEDNSLVSPTESASAESIQWEDCKISTVPTAGSGSSRLLTSTAATSNDPCCTTSSASSFMTVAAQPPHNHNSPIEIVFENRISKFRSKDKGSLSTRSARRREQNRISQQIFRARKEEKLREAKTEIDSLKSQIYYLQERIAKLERWNRDVEEQMLALQIDTNATAVKMPPQRLNTSILANLS